MNSNLKDIDVNALPKYFLVKSKKQAKKIKKQTISVYYDLSNSYKNTVLFKLLNEN